MVRSPATTKVRKIAGFPNFFRVFARNSMGQNMGQPPDPYRDPYTRKRRIGRERSGAKA